MTHELSDATSGLVQFSIIKNTGEKKKNIYFKSHEEINEAISH